MTDEEQRLRDAVVEASLEWLGNFTPTGPHQQCVADLRDYLAKASAPEPESRWSVGDKVMIEGTITHIAGKWFAVKMFNSDAPSSHTINFQEKHLHSRAPAPIARCEPPDHLRHFKWHWLQSNDGNIEPWVFRGNEWLSIPTSDSPESIEQMTAYGWSWHSACRPDQRVDPTEDDIRKIAGGLGLPQKVADYDIIAFAYAILAGRRA